MFRGGLPDDFDHLIVAVDRLDEAIPWFEEQLGVRPAEGGRHAKWGTHNALLSLGSRRYLELLAPDPDAPPDARERGEKAFGLSRRASPFVVGWCAATTNLDERVAEAARGGVQLGAPIAGGRDLSDGTQLRWRSTPPDFVSDELAEGLMPFFICWGDSPHPGQDAPPGCRLVRLEGEHPDPERLWKMLAAVGTRLSVSRGPRARMIATIEGPRGSVTLSDAPTVARRG